MRRNDVHADGSDITDRNDYSGCINIYADHIIFGETAVKGAVLPALGVISLLLVLAGILLRPVTLSQYVSGTGMLLIIVAGGCVVCCLYFLSIQLSVLSRKNQELAMQVSLLNQENERILAELEELKKKN